MHCCLPPSISLHTCRGNTKLQAYQKRSITHVSLFNTLFCSCSKRTPASFPCGVVLETDLLLNLFGTLYENPEVGNFVYSVRPTWNSNRCFPVQICERFWTKSCPSCVNECVLCRQGIQQVPEATFFSRLHEKWNLLVSMWGNVDAVYVLPLIFVCLKEHCEVEIYLHNSGAIRK